MDLTFSQLLKILKPQLSKGKNIPDFTQHVIQSTVCIPDGEDDSALDISEASLKAYYHGNNSIDNLAKKLSGYIDASKLYEEIDKLNENARQLLADKLQKFYPGIGLDDVAHICSAAMEKVFNEAAARSSQPSDNSGETHTSQLSAITDEELTLVLETKGICRFDDCGNPLSVTVNGKKQYVFSITKIDPVLDDSLDNSIALCPNCSAKYKLLGQPSEVERLKHIKKQLKMRRELDEVAAMTKREEGIRLVIERIANIRSEDLTPLNYEPVAVEKKILSNNLLLWQKILSYKLLEIIGEIDIPSAYDHFAQGEAVDPPFITYLLPGTDNFAADGKVYYKINEVHIELYTDAKDPEVEGSVEAVLDEHGIFYDKTEVWIDTEKLYEVLYSFQMEG